jgi:polyisoprenyl-phosphate glycosyltransferase
VTGRLSIIIPMFNEEGNVEPLFARLRPLIRQIRTEFGLAPEVIVNDNCSTDRTADELRAYADRHDPQEFDLRVFRFARNIGFQKSILVGYRKARGDAVAQIDADLQDPPELLLDFLRKWREGYKVVYGVRERREEGALMHAVRRLFYRLIDRISDDDLPHDSGDFRLIDRSLVDVICQLHDHDPYLRGLVASLGLRQIGIPYARAARQRGKSKFGFSELVNLAVNGITNHSTVPLRLASYLALVVVAIAALLILYYVAGWIIAGEEIPLGFMTQIVLQLGSLAALSFLIAIQGLYINRIYNQVKERPLAIIEHSVQKGVMADETRPQETSRVEVLWTGRPGAEEPEAPGGRNDPAVVASRRSGSSVSD